MLRCVAAVEHADNKARSKLTIFLFPKPSVNKDFMRPTAEAALTAIFSRLSESDRNITGLIARWTARIFSDNKSNPVVNERYVIANRGVVVARDVDEIAKQTVLVAKLGAIDKRGIVVSLAGNVGKCVCRLSPPNDRHLCLSPTCRRHYLMLTNFLAVGVVSVTFVPDILSYMYVGISTSARCMNNTW